MLELLLHLEERKLLKLDLIDIVLVAGPSHQYLDCEISKKVKIFGLFKLTSIPVAQLGEIQQTRRSAFKFY
jgi:hypothetical protein